MKKGKLVTVYERSKKRSGALSPAELSIVDKKLKELAPLMPSEFARKMTALSEADAWKATQWRQFLLYLIAIVMKGVLSKARYNHCLDLYLAARIMSSAPLLEKYGDAAEQLLRSFVKKYSIQREKRPHPVALMKDDMAIKERLNIVGTDLVGFPNLGKEFQHLNVPSNVRKTMKNSDDRPPLAKEICVFMVVCLGQRVKIPVGYFVHAKLSGEQPAEMVKVCMKKLYTVGAVVKAIVTDGFFGNTKVAKLFGCNIKPVKRAYGSYGDGLGSQVPSEEFQTFFKHPCDSSMKVYYILDVCYMLKLVRNALAARKTLKDADGNNISWCHITKLHNMQAKDGVKLASYLTEMHVKWHQNKQKVAIAAQSLSNSVATSLKFSEMVNTPGFEQASSTAKFCSIFNNLFDVLNSFSTKSYGLKRPMSIRNESQWSPTFDEGYHYILGLPIKEKGGPLFVSLSV
ncbi:hypothetical protein FOCC_FOCC017081 [Frankliniella occidentalis]|nr:hypothetical protein FOCC_FOCC017081 [Frankliniella occidentalis]